MKTLQHPPEPCHETKSKNVSRGAGRAPTDLITLQTAGIILGSGTAAIAAYIKHRYLRAWSGGPNGSRLVSRAEVQKLARKRAGIREDAGSEVAA